VAKVQGKGGDVLLRTGLRTYLPVGHCAVDNIEATLPLTPPQLEMGTPPPREVLRPPLNVEDAVGRTATYRCEYAEPTIDQIQVVPVWEDGVVVGGPRQARVAKGAIAGCELRIAVGRQIYRGEGPIVQSEGEG